MEGGVAFELEARGRGAEPNDVGDVAVVDVRVSPLGVLFAGRRAVAPIAQLEGAWGLGDGGEGGTRRARRRPFEACYADSKHAVRHRVQLKSDLWELELIILNASVKWELTSYFFSS